MSTLQFFYKTISEPFSLSPIRQAIWWLGLEDPMEKFFG